MANGQHTIEAKALIGQVASTPDSVTIRVNVSGSLGASPTEFPWWILILIIVAILLLLFFGLRRGLKRPGNPATESIGDRLVKLKELRDRGLLAEEEYQSKRTDLLGKL